MPVAKPMNPNASVGEALNRAMFMVEVTSKYVVIYTTTEILNKNGKDCFKSDKLRIVIAPK
jgi:hypothetical protein